MDDNGRWVALTSEFDRLYWPGRGLYDGHRLRHRVSLYSADLKKRIAVFDGARYPINAVAFHPSGPWIAIGTGSYDGGYMFEGDLLLWNWETNETRSLLGESREVTRVADWAARGRRRCNDGEHAGPSGRCRYLSTREARVDSWMELWDRRFARAMKEGRP